MNRRAISARILVAEGVLPLIVAAIHLLIIPVLRDTLVRRLSAPDFQFVWPPLVLAFVVLGILLVPLTLSTIYCASGVRRGERWAWRWGITNALAVLKRAFQWAERSMRKIDARWPAAPSRSHAK
jgi:hypothetical protein